MGALTRGAEAPARAATCDHLGLCGGGARLARRLHGLRARSRAAPTRPQGWSPASPGGSAAAASREAARPLGCRTGSAGIAASCARAAGRQCRPRSTPGRASCRIPWRSTAPTPSFSRERPSHGVGRAAEVVMSRSNWWLASALALALLVLEGAGADAQQRSLTGGRPGARRLGCVSAAPVAHPGAGRDLARQCGDPVAPHAAGPDQPGPRGVPDARAGAHPARSRPGGARSAARTAERGHGATPGAATRRAAARHDRRRGGPAQLRRHHHPAPAGRPCGERDGRGPPWSGAVGHRHRAQPRGLRSIRARPRTAETCTTCRRG